MGFRVHWHGVRLAWALCGAQFLVALAAAAIAGVGRGGTAALAALFGGLVAIVPGVYFAVRVYLRRRGNGAAEVLGAFYRAEVGKLVLTAVLFWIGARLFGPQFAPLILTCTACLAVNWVMLAFTRGGDRADFTNRKPNDYGV
jgi:ATP synthase protein I